MRTNKIRIALATFAVMLLFVGSVSAWWPFSKDKNESAVQGEVTDLLWEDLIPDDFVQPENPLIDMSQEEIDKLMDGSEESNAEMARLEAIFNYAPTVPEIDGLRVKIPAYVTPLEFDGQERAKEFLLVPYIGACMHTPPPPANQVVHALAKKEIVIPNMYEAVFAIGTIRTESVKSVLAESGYSLQVEKLIPYTEE